jgi:hypothetical protein
MPQGNQALSRNALQAKLKRKKKEPPLPAAQR